MLQAALCATWLKGVKCLSSCASDNCKDGKCKKVGNKRVNHLSRPRSYSSAVITLKHHADAVITEYCGSRSSDEVTPRLLLIPCIYIQ